MPSKTERSAAPDKAAQLQIPAELLDQLGTGPLTAGHEFDAVFRFGGLSGDGAQRALGIFPDSEHELVGGRKEFHGLAFDGAATG